MLNLLAFSDKYRNTGLLILRIGIGGMFLFHGYPKIVGGVEQWQMLGTAMTNLGIHFAPVFWGFMSAITEFFGGILIIFGLFFRPACILLTINMLVATSMHLGRGDGIAGASHAIELGIVFLSLILIGPGNYSLDKLFEPKKNQRI